MQLVGYEPNRNCRAERAERGVRRKPTLLLLSLVVALLAGIFVPVVLASPIAAAAGNPPTYTVTGTADGNGVCDASNNCPTLRAAVTAANAASGATINVPT